MSELVHKTKVVPFIDANAQGSASHDWIQVKKSTTFSLSLNAQTKTFDFISSKVAQTEIDSYQPQLSLSLTMFKGEEDYELVHNKIFYKLPTGTDAHRDMLVVFYQETGTDTDNAECYKAWLVDSVLQVSSVDTVNNSMEVTALFSEITEGAVHIVDSTPSFTAGTWTDDSFVAA